MIKKLVWTAIFISIGTLGSLAAFNIADIWGSMESYWSESMSPFISGLSKNDLQIEDLFSFIGGTVFICFVVGPVWYLWKGTGLIKFGLVGLIIRIVIIAILFSVPTILGILHDYTPIFDDNEAAYNYTNMAFTWLIILIALIGLWVRS